MSFPIFEPERPEANRTGAAPGSRTSHRTPGRIPGQIYLWVAVIIFAAASSVTRKLTDIGAHNLIEGRNPISLCNVLFVGNLCALLTLLPLYREQLTLRSFRRFSWGDWLSMAIVALLAGAVAPALIFDALSHTLVNTVVLIGRLEPPLTLALAVWLLRERTNRWEISGTIVSLVGVVLMIGLQGIWETRDGSSLIGRGGLETAIAAVILAISNTVSKVRLTRIPVGLFTIVRTGLGTVIFFIIALLIYGSHHFMDVFSPLLWQWMLVYGAIIVAAGQSFWLTGLKHSSGAKASLVSALNPVASIVAAYLIVGEAPTPAQYIGGGIILSGIVLSQRGIWRKLAYEASDRDRHPHKMETGIGFKGI